MTKKKNKNLIVVIVLLGVMGFVIGAEYRYYVTMGEVIVLCNQYLEEEYGYFYSDLEFKEIEPFNSSIVWKAKVFYKPVVRGKVRLEQIHFLLVNVETKQIDEVPLFT